MKSKIPNPFCVPAEAIGREGLQMFVDAGLPVDERLVNALVKEVLLEKMSTLTGQYTATDHDGPSPPKEAPRPAAPRPRSRPQSPTKDGALENSVPPPQVGYNYRALKGDPQCYMSNLRNDHDRCCYFVIPISILK